MPEIQKQVEFAALIPAEDQASVENALPKSLQGCKITPKFTEAKASEVASGFDPGTIAMVWVGIKIVGSGATAVGLGVAANYVYDKITQPKYQMSIRFKTGPEFVLVSNSETDLAEFENALDANGVTSVR